MSVAALIPVLADSETALRPLAGKPTLAYIIEAARGVPGINNVYVATPHESIGNVARQYGAVRSYVSYAKPLHLPDAKGENHLLADDTITEFLKECTSTDVDHTPNTIVQLSYQTPLLLSENIANTLEKLTDENAELALLTTPATHRLWQATFPFRVPHTTESGQHLEYLSENGACTAFHTEAWRRQQNGKDWNKIALTMTRPQRLFRLQNSIDWQIAELYLREREQENKRAILPDSISAVIMDFDGVFTDNKVVVFQDGREAVLCSRGDGYGLNGLQKTGVPMLVISKEPNPVVAARCAKLKIECIQGIDDKLPVLKAWLVERNLDIRQAVYVGNDTNDAQCLAAVGCGVVPSDAHPDVIPLARLVLNATGGNGALREFCDLITGSPS